MSTLSRRSALAAAVATAAAVRPSAAVAAPAGSGPEFWQTPAGAVWKIQRGDQHASFVELGGGILDYTVGGVAFVEAYPLEAPVRSAGRVLAPWPNRLGNGLYTWNGTAYQVPINELTRNNAIHGLSRWLPFRPVRRSASAITLAAILAPSQGYPFPLEIVTRWSLVASGLCVEHTVTNLGPAPAPFGLGVHPHFRIGDALVNDCVLAMSATERLTVDARFLPIGRVPVTGTPYDFSTPRAIGDLELDTTFIGLARTDDGSARIRLTAPGGRGFEYWQDASFGWVQLFTGVGPAGRPRGSLAVEPMTCPPDAFRSGDSLISLPPHGRFTGTWGVSPF